MIPTPQVYLPLSVAREFAPGTFPTLDGRRVLSVADRAAAWEICTYVTMAQTKANAAWARYERARTNERDQSVAWLAWVDAIQAQRQVATLLPFMADLYNLHRLPVTSAPEWMALKGLHWGTVIEPSLGRTWSFERPDQWRDYAADIEQRLDHDLRANGTVIDSGPPTGMGADPITVATLIVIGLAIVTTGVVAYLVSVGIGRICDYFAHEQVALDGRLACFDAHLERWLETDDPREKEAMLLCHEQAEEIARGSAVFPLLIIGGSAIALSLLWRRKSPSSSAPAA